MSPTPTSAKGTATATPGLLWSTNTHLKYRIQQTFHGGRHWVWCSPAFEGATLSKYAIGAGQPPSSDPATIYRQLLRAVQTRDEGCEKIASQKKILKGLAVAWHNDHIITEEERNEIVAMVKKATFEDWKPLIYVIPGATVADRIDLVSREKRASHEPEYIIKDLLDGEFQIIEPISRDLR